ncbi:MAG: haloacid dehalogenase type II [Clostridia bacterium]
MVTSSRLAGLDALVFDAYGTLFDVHSVVRRCDACWPGKGTALSAAWRSKQLEYTWLRSLMGRYAPFSQVTRESLEHTCEAMKLDLSREHADGLMDEYRRLSLFPEVAKEMERLGGLKCAILSNGSPDMLDPLVAQSGLKLAAVLSVDALKVYKPAPQVYQLAVEKLSAGKERVGFVSSNCWDALGAKSFGFRVFWINRAGAPLDRLGFTPDAIIRSLADLA